MAWPQDLGAAPLLLAHYPLFLGMLHANAWIALAHRLRSRAASTRSSTTTLTYA